MGLIYNSQTPEEAFFLISLAISRHHHRYWQMAREFRSPGRVGCWGGQAVIPMYGGLVVNQYEPFRFHPEYYPVVVFGGTRFVPEEFTEEEVANSLSDITSDLNPTGVGYFRWAYNAGRIKTLLQRVANNNEGRKPFVVGYSLGGALAQYTAWAFPSLISGCVTFQSPKALFTNAVHYFNNRQNRRLISSLSSHSFHYQIDKDIVDNFGEIHFPGSIIRFNHPIEPNTLYTTHTREPFASLYEITEREIRQNTQRLATLILIEIDSLGGMEKANWSDDAYRPRGNIFDFTLEYARSGIFITTELVHFVARYATGIGRAVRVVQSIINIEETLEDLRQMLEDSDSDSDNEEFYFAFARRIGYTTTWTKAVFLLSSGIDITRLASLNFEVDILGESIPARELIPDDDDKENFEINLRALRASFARIPRDRESTVTRLSNSFLVTEDGALTSSGVEFIRHVMGQAVHSQYTTIEILRSGIKSRFKIGLNAWRKYLGYRQRVPPALIDEQIKRDFLNGADNDSRRFIASTALELILEEQLVRRYDLVEIQPLSSSEDSRRAANGLYRHSSIGNYTSDESPRPPANEISDALICQKSLKTTIKLLAGGLGDARDTEIQNYEGVYSQYNEPPLYFDLGSTNLIGLTGQNRTIKNFLGQTNVMRIPNYGYIRINLVDVRLAYAYFRILLAESIRSGRRSSRAIYYRDPEGFFSDSTLQKLYCTERNLVDLSEGRWLNLGMPTLLNQRIYKLQPDFVYVDRKSEKIIVFDATFNLTLFVVHNFKTELYAAVLRQLHFRNERVRSNFFDVTAIDYRSASRQYHSRPKHNN